MDYEKNPHPLDSADHHCGLQGSSWNDLTGQENITESVYASGILRSKNQYQVFSTVNGLLQKFTLMRRYHKKGTPLFSILNETSTLYRKMPSWLQTSQTSGQTKTNSKSSNSILTWPKANWWMIHCWWYGSKTYGPRILARRTKSKELNSILRTPKRPTPLHGWDMRMKRGGWTSYLNRRRKTFRSL